MPVESDVDVVLVPALGANVGVVLGTDLFLAVASII